MYYSSSSTGRDSSSPDAVGLDWLTTLPRFADPPLTAVGTQGGSVSSLSSPGHGSPRHSNSSGSSASMSSPSSSSSSGRDSGNDMGDMGSSVGTTSGERGNSASPNASVQQNEEEQENQPRRLTRINLGQPPVRLLNYEGYATKPFFAQECEDPRWYGGRN
ncbi:unnamed protein product [Linum trigynum]|uniref:Uncharacterized protein n=1 Tax=Linum trigynum TaxID=586398 RepID=A0AAV2GNM1_9ROSI